MHGGRDVHVSFQLLGFAKAQLGYWTGSHQQLECICLPAVKALLCSAVARIALVKPDKAKGVENMVLQMAQRGQLNEKVIRQSSNWRPCLTVYLHLEPSLQVALHCALILPLRSLQLDQSGAWCSIA